MCKICKDKKQLVETSAEANAQVASDLAIQMKLETPFAKDIRRLLNQIITDYELFYSTTGQSPNLQPYRDDLTAILRSHYRKTNKKFKNNITGSLEQTEEVKQLENAVSVAMAGYITQQSVTQSNLINRTTQTDLNDITRQVITNASLEGERLSNAETATQVKKQYKKQIPARADTIAQYETGNIAEESKSKEAEIIAASSLVIGGVSVAGILEKTWATILDSKTRPAHAVADGQVRPVGQTFLVGGENLRRPKDPRGSAGNIIRCRCQTTYSIGRPT